jgi:hypothetical protein
MLVHVEFAEIMLGQVMLEKAEKAVDHMRPDCQFQTFR